MTTPREKFVALLNRFNAARGDDLTEAHAAVLQAYDEAAGREGEAAIALESAARAFDELHERDRGRHNYYGIAAKLLREMKAAMSREAQG